MGFFQNFLLLGFLSAIVYFLALEKEYTWTIRMPIREENYGKTHQLLESFDFIKYHPFYVYHELKSENKEKKEKYYELHEKVDALFFSTVLKSHGVFKQINSDTFSFIDDLKVLGVFPANFDLKISVSGSEIVENVKIRGPFIVAFLVKTVAYPEHVMMLNSISRDI